MQQQELLSRVVDWMEGELTQCGIGSISNDPDKETLLDIEAVYADLGGES